MIPIRLRLRNFLSYGEHVQPLDFAGFRLACLCGENGHGKSALLDAITWALWGRARISERRDASEDELIHLGRTDMEVEYEFELDGLRYVVLRKRALRSTARRRTSQAVLEFHVRDGAALRPLTGDNMKATQEQINRVLHLNYETFVNSAFILQGRADEFTRKTAGERKAILSDLLALDLYDQLEEAAREQARERESERRATQATIEGFDRELAKEPGYRRELANAEREVGRLDHEVERLDADYQQQQAEKLRLEEKAKQRDAAQSRLGQRQATLRGLNAQLAPARGRLQEQEALVARAAEIRASHAALLAAQRELAALDAKLSELPRLTRQRTPLEKAITRARTALEGDRRAAAADVARLRRELAAEPDLQQQLVELNKRLAALDELDREREAKEAEVTAHEREAKRLGDENVRIRDEGTLLKERLDLLAKAGATCPVCEGELDAAGRARLQERYAAEREDLLRKYRANADEAKRLGEQATALRARLQELAPQLAQRQPVGRQLGGVQQSLDNLETHRTELAAATERQGAAVRRLEAGDYAQDEQVALRRLDEQVQALAYDEPGHQAARERCRELEPSQTEKVQLESAERDLPGLRQQVAGLVDLAQEAERQAAAERTLLAQLAGELATQPAVLRQVEAARQALDDAIAERKRAQEERGRAQQQLNHCDYLRGERGQREAALAVAVHEKALHDELAVAFGKKGIQAMIIESAIPEIEREANDVLARMSDGRLHVKIETQREARTGDGTVETLEIKIADELGVRNLELYSGGEAFRVNFAIRIALSKLLARRAGARVQMLVVDEGFGTQDAFGRQRLVEAINAVAQDFEKIIVITHIDELKDAFPTRIDVVKGPEGSQATVS